MVVPSPESVVTAVIAALTTHGPLRVDELADLLQADGFELGPDPEEFIDGSLDDDSGPVMPVADGRWAWLPALLDGRVFTHRLTPAEAEHDLILIAADIGPLSYLTELPTYHRLTDGSSVADVAPLTDGATLVDRGVPDDVVADDGALLFESGRFAALGAGAGDLVGLRVTGQGFELTRVDDPVTSEIAARMGDLLARNPDEPITIDGAIWTLCSEHDDLLRRPTVPLAEALGGLALDGDWIAPAGFDFVAHRLHRRIDRVMSRYDLDEDGALAVLATVRLYDQVRELVDLVAESGGHIEGLDDSFGQLPWVADPTVVDARADGDRVFEERRTVAAVLGALADPDVVDAVLAEVDSTDPRAASALGLFAETIEPMAPRPARPALRWLRAVAHERRGEVELAEQTFSAAESLDPAWPPTLISLARYASDRGDAERALTLLRRAGAPPDDEFVQLLERFLPTPRPDLGRNQPCWCGSGRKYKVCHLHREQLSLDERAGWLYRKVGMALMDGAFGHQLLDVAQARSEHWPESDGLFRALDDPIVADAVLFEGGALAAFLAARGRLLPDDERSLAEQWILLDRSVHEVVAVRRGQGMTMRDVRTGDVHDVHERTASKQVKPGQLYCTRIVPAGETMQIFGGLEPVTLIERDPLIALLDDEPDPVDLVTFLSGRFAPPQMRNTEGDSLMLCEATLRVADPAATREALDQRYDRRDDRPDDRPGWFEHVVTHGVERIRAGLDLNGDELRIQANSRARFDRVLAVVQALDPSATVLDETREPAGDLVAMQQLVARTPAAARDAPDPSADPELATALDDFVAKYEKAWLDDPIPALAGYTPRQCADDPTRRPDLIALLDSFPNDDGQPGAMSTARLRAALGLG